MAIGFYIVKTAYVDYLRSFAKLKRVFDNKEKKGAHTRKYIGVVLSIGGYQYYAPVSSPKPSDYIMQGSERVVRKSIVPIIRMVSCGKDKTQELKGTIKLSSMIPVPPSMLVYYNFRQESDINYKIWIEKEWDFVRSNEKMITRCANVLYRQKTQESILYANSDKKPGYLSSTIDFRYAEEIHDKYVQIQKLKNENLDIGF